MPKKSVMIKIGVAVAIVLAVLFGIVLTKKKKSVSTPVPSLIPVSEGFEGDGRPIYTDVEQFEEGFDEDS